MNRRDFLPASSALAARAATPFPRSTPDVCIAAEKADSVVRGLGLGLAERDTERVYFTYDGTPLLSFGGLSDMTFCASEDAYDYKKWADWQAAHGMNHCRAYLPGSWIHVEKFARENGGAIENVLFPFSGLE